MKRILVAVAVGAVVMIAAATPAVGDAATDLAWVRSEIAKPARIRKEELIDKVLGTVIADPTGLTPTEYVDARLLAHARSLAGKEDLTEPAKRLALNAVRTEILGTLAERYLGPAATTPDTRLDVHRLRFRQAAAITDAAAAAAANTAVAKTFVEDLAATCGKSAGRAPDRKEAALRMALRELGNIRNAAHRQDAEIAIASMIIDTGTDAARAFYLRRAQCHLRNKKNVSAAAADYAALATHAKASPVEKIDAHLRRMNLLAAHGRTDAAAADAAVLAAIDPADRTLLPLNKALEIKRRACGMAMAAGEMTWAQYHQAVETMLLAVMGADELSVDDKAGRVTQMLLSAADVAARHRRMDAALPLARTAYNIAPNAHVARAVATVQKVLANRNYKPVADATLSVHHSTADIAAAEAFYDRQAGAKTVPLTDAEKAAAAKARKDAIAKASSSRRRRAAERMAVATTKRVPLAPDLSNDAMFPRQLAGVASPFSLGASTALTEIADGHDDPLMRALAMGMLDRPDDAIALMAEQVNAAGIDRAELAVALNRAAVFVRAKLESVALANAFLRSQSLGPAGADGKEGTPDDAPNPLAAE